MARRAHKFNLDVLITSKRAEHTLSWDWWAFDIAMNIERTQNYPTYQNKHAVVAVLVF